VEVSNPRHVVFFKPFHYLVGSGEIPSLHLECDRGKPLPRPMEPFTQGSYLFARDVVRGNPFLDSIKPNARGFPFARDVSRGNPTFSYETRWVEVFLLITRDFKVLIKTMAHQQTLPSNLVPVIIQGILFPVVSQLGRSNSTSWNSGPPSRLPFLAMLNFPDLSKLMNDSVFHDPNWPSVPTKLPFRHPKV
jgi:hypothetical protein